MRTRETHVAGPSCGNYVHAMSIFLGISAKTGTEAYRGYAPNNLFQVLSPCWRPERPTHIYTSPNPQQFSSHELPSQADEKPTAEVPVVPNNYLQVLPPAKPPGTRRPTGVERSL